MLAVLLILGFVATIALPSFMRPSDGLKLRTTANELQSALRSTRAAAITAGSEKVLLIDVDRHTFRSAVLPPRSFASDIDTKMTFAAAARSGKSEGGFRFFPDGSSTGGDVTLSLRGMQARICVDWLTGQVRQEQSC
jgi:general secretion pathway protein H